MKSKILKLLLLSLVLVLVFGAVSASAFVPYDTYTYSIDGEALMSPAAYMITDPINYKEMGLTVNPTDKPINFSDIITDYQGNVYLSDKGNNRILILNKYYKLIKTIDGYFDEGNSYQTFGSADGMYVSNPEKNAVGVENYLYVCDRVNKRIVMFDPDNDYAYVDTINCPVEEGSSDGLLTYDEFAPMAVAVDIYGRVFVVSENCNKGIIVLASNGDFTGFIGAQKVAVNFFEELWKNFQTDEQKKTNVQATTFPFNNITIDYDGFVYATTDKVPEAQQYGAIRSKSATYSPVKKLNSTGVEIMKRNGFFDPGGEVDVFKSSEVSNITDITLGRDGTWTILDVDRSRLYTYDDSGNLLFAFGDTNNTVHSALGCGTVFAGITYQVVDGVYYLLVLNNNTAKNGYELNVYIPTDYCNTLMTALGNQSAHNYEQAILDWKEVLTLNNNFDLAYIGIGKALFNQGKYSEAYETLQNAYETQYASKAFAEMRKDIINTWIFPILIVVIVLVILLFKFLGYAKKRNKATSLKVGKRTYWEELLYAFHLVFHPFDGFWDLKHERRGSVRAATTILAITMLAFLYQSVGQGYLFNPRGDYSMAFMSLLAVFLPVMLFAIANWCLTTLFDGEGSFRDIYIALCYSLAPLPPFIIVSTILSQVFTTSEASMVSLITTIAFIWTVILIFFGMVVTHDYSIGKNILTILGTILAIVIIIFIAVLFSTLVMKMVTFVISIFTELANRA